MEELNQIIGEHIIECFISKNKLSAKQNMNDWFKNDTRIYRDPNDRWNIKTKEFCDYVNSKLSSKGIKISEMNPIDERIELRYRGQCGYIYVEHPDGDCYCIIGGGNPILNFFNLYYLNKSNGL